MTSHDPLTRALDALQYLYTPEMDPAALAAWQEVRDAILEAQAQHRAAMTSLKEEPRSEKVGGPAVPGGQAESELLQQLELYAEQPLLPAIRD